MDKPLTISYGQKLIIDLPSDSPSDTTYALTVLNFLRLVTHGPKQTKRVIALLAASQINIGDCLADARAAEKDAVTLAKKTSSKARKPRYVTQHGPTKSKSTRKGGAVNR